MSKLKIFTIVVTFFFLGALTAAGIAFTSAHYAMNEIRADGGHWAVDQSHTNKHGLPTTKWVEVK
jgi:hypothetical protein